MRSLRRCARAMLRRRLHAVAGSLIASAELVRLAGGGHRAHYDIRDRLDGMQ
jgi:hypothetical protein